MNKGVKLIDIKNIDDLDKLDDFVRYLNIDISNPNEKVIDYFKENGKFYSYSDLNGDYRGYTYTNYEMFLKGEGIIKDIINSIPDSLNDIEKARYVYIKLGKILSIDINTLEEKNSNILFEVMSEVNNIWTSLVKKKVSNITLCKIYMYILRRIGILCDVIMVSENGHFANKIEIDGKSFIVDLTKDLANIKGNFALKYFSIYNSLNIDKKIGYIKSEYSDFVIYNKLKNTDCMGDDSLLVILNKIKDVININGITPLELGEIYRNIFNEYYPNYDIRINNLFVCSGLERSHFIVITYNGMHYSYSFAKNMYVMLSEEDILKNINNNSIGIYDNEDFVMSRSEVLV